MPHDDNYIIKLEGELENLSLPDHCTKKTGSGPLKCSCLHVLHDQNVCWAVSKYLLALFKKDTFNQDTTLIDWYRYAHSNNSQFVLPFDASHYPSCSTTTLSITTLQSIKVCTSALLALVQLSKNGWGSIVRAARTAGVAKPHGMVIMGKIMQPSWRSLK